MSSGIIENAEALKTVYLNTDITDVSAVQTARKEISENAYVDGKEKYLEALNAATPANIYKARKYQNMASGMIIKNLGWVIMVVFAIWMGTQDWEDDSTWQSLGFWVGAGIQIYIAVLKSAWSKLTLAGAVIHPALKTVTTTTMTSNCPSKAYTSQAMTTAAQQEQSSKYIFCSECGRQNKEGTQFCENCGAKL